MLPSPKRANPAVHLPLPAVLMGLGLMASQPATAQGGVAVADQYSTPINTVLSGFNVTSNDLLVGNASVQVFTTTPPQHGSLLMQPNGAFTYTPQSGFEGLDHFRYDLVNLGNSLAEVTIVVGVHDVPALGGAAIGALSAGIAALAMRRRRKR
ncbi:MAG TPA: Ig-like domain-containing protein [Casimicrobiaceae bacterium]|nr:Ig-like domain-containing protein [Casimicrobiaceae bacterium]